MKKLFTLLALFCAVVSGNAATKDDFTDGEIVWLTTDNCAAESWISVNSANTASVMPASDLKGGEYTGEKLTVYRVKQWKSRYLEFAVKGITAIEFYAWCPNSTATRTLKATLNESSEKNVKDVVTINAAESQLGSGSIEGLDAAKEYAIRIFADGDLDLYALKVSVPASDAPQLSVSDKEFTFKLTPTELTKSEKFTVTGKNLTDGNYYPTLPKVDGLSLSPAYFTVSGGEVNQEFTITYASDVDVAEGKDAISATVDGKTIEIVVNYSCRATAYKQSVVSEAATWDWSKLTETVELTDDDPDKGTVATSPAKSEEFLLAEIDDRINFVKEFGDATAVKMEGMQYPSRGGYAQGKTIKFTTSVPGTFTVEYSNTGKDNSNRWLTINGTQFGDEAVGTTMKSATSPVVNAGEVVISTTESYLRFKTITFTPSDAPATVAGDVNGDGSVNITDVTLTIDYILGKNPADFDEKAADVNNDTIVNVTDVTTIIDIVLGK